MLVTTPILGEKNSLGKQLTGGTGFASGFQRGQIKVARAEVRLDTCWRMRCSEQGQREGLGILGQDTLFPKKACYEKT